MSASSGLTAAPKINIVVPMAGRGLRFAEKGIPIPKPLVDLHGKPFFWWATESLLRVCDVDQLCFVVLKEHVERFGISGRIMEFYPHASIAVIPEVTSGSAETAWIGVQQIENANPVAINDCDHAFVCQEFGHQMQRLQSEPDCDGGVMLFQSTLGCYSYALMDQSNHIIRTAEKQVISNHAIAGCYLFASAQVYSRTYADYRDVCPYKELFISGMYNLLLDRGRKILGIPLAQHFSFGTPEECAEVAAPMKNDLGAWL